MAWLKNFKTKRAIPASQLKWADDDSDTQSVADVVGGKLNSSDLLNLVYPVGSIYMSVNATNPATLFGGTWVQMKDQFLIGAGGSYNLGSTGGEATHRLTVNEIPSHNHSIYANARFTVSGTTPSGTGISGIRAETSAWGEYGGADWYKPESGATGGGAAHNNMPPYIAVNMWRRTA